MMIDPILVTIFAVLIIVFFVTYDRCRVQTINEQELQIDDLLMVAKMRDTYVAELQRRLERKQEQQATIVVLPEFGHITFDARHDICYAVSVYKN